jgi:M6 family metalloprotease-like protein
VTLVYSDGSTKDISKKSSYYSVALKDPLGHSISSKSPFTIKGLYSAVLTYRGNTAISSSVLSLNVGDNVSQTLTEKTSATTAFNYADLEASCLSNLSFPTTGEVHGLVIPIEFTDYPFSQSAYGSDYLSAINRAFNGNGKTDTGYWESVASYYSKSSLGKLNFSFDIAPVYASGKATSDLLASYGEYSGSLFMGSSALNDYVKNHGSDSTQKFDGDKDGYIDGVWFVYSAPDYASGAYNAYPSSMSLFWAFCTDSLGYEANLASPALHSFGWSSIDFLSKQTSAPKVDAHTFIHETGHLLSLPDYYSYDRTGASSSGPLGGLAMMDLNIGDQDSFSKIALGWADPYVVTDSCTITIKPNESSGDAILLADRWNGTAFDEYLLLDLQTPTGVNQSDSLASYNFRPTYYSVPGVRMLHVDSRMGKFQYLNAAESGSNAGIFCIPDSQTGEYYLSDDKVEALVAKGPLSKLSKDLALSQKDRTPGYTVINCNSPSRAKVASAPYNANSELSLIGADNVNCLIDDTSGSNDSLFEAGSSWSLAKRGIYYFSSSNSCLNNGNALPYVISVLACDQNSATIQFRKY